MKPNSKLIFNLVGLLLFLISGHFTLYLIQQKQGIETKAAGESTIINSALNSPYGVHGSPDISRNITEMINIAENLSKAGVKWVRPATYWPWHTVETNKGQWRWDRMDSVYQINYNYGLETLVTLQWTPKWASSAPGCPDNCPSRYNVYPPKNIEDWKTFVRQMVTRYGSSGKNIVKYWEIWNEPDLDFMIVPPGIDKVNAYYQMLKSAYEVIKEVDPSAKVVSAGFTHVNLDNGEFVDQLLKKGAGNYFDIFNFHTYESDPTIAIKKSKALLSKYGLNKPMWVTETNPKNSLIHSSSEQETALSLSNWYSKIINAGVKKVFWFYTVNICNFESPVNCDPDTDPKYRSLGLLHSDFSIQTLIYNAYKNMAVSYTSPGKPNLVLPANNTQITSPKFTFQWNAASPGSNPLNGYIIQIDNDSNFLSPDFEDFIQIPKTNLEFISQQIAKGDYYWRIKAQDSQGNFGSWSNVWKVITFLAGDLNNNDKVDIIDYEILLSNFGKIGSPGWILSDIDKNGKVDIFDYNVLVGNFGK